MQFFKKKDVMRKRYSVMVSSLFICVALVHFTRAIYGWELLLNGYRIPLWVSWVAVVVLGYLAVRGLRQYAR